MNRGIDLEGAVVVITGAPSGIGRAAAQRFARKGSHVVLAARGEESLREAAAECRSAGVRAIGGVPPAVQHRIIETNLLGAMHGARAALTTLREQRSGVIVNVASLYGRMTTPYVSAYATSKFGLLGFSHKPPPPVGSPERAARAVVSCAERPRRRSTVGNVQQVASWFHAALPRTYSDVAPTMTELVAIGTEARPHHDGNVFDPMPELNAVHGDWRSPLKRASAGLGVRALAAGGVAVRRWRY